MKPANIWLEEVGSCTEDGDGSFRVRILDFGLVNRELNDQCLTTAGALVGTPGYMAPEQVRSPSEAGPRADLFSLGVILYECVAGNLPFRAIDWLTYSDSLATTKVDVSALDASAPLRQLTLSLLSLQADDRPSSAKQVANALRAIAEAKPRRTRTSRSQLVFATMIVLAVTTIAVATLLKPKANDSEPLATSNAKVVAPSVTLPSPDNTAAKHGTGSPLRLVREERFDQPSYTQHSETMRFGVQEGVYFVECDGSRMRAVWKVFRLPLLPKDFVVELDLRVHNTEYGVWFRPLGNTMYRRNWELWGNIKGSGRWKVDQVASRFDDSQNSWLIQGKQTMAQGAAGEEPWLPNGQWRTMRIECIDDSFCLFVDDQSIATFAASPQLSPDEVPEEDGLLLMLQSNAPDQNPRLEINRIRVWAPAQPPNDLGG
ncbi:MAG: protein kinase [Planctomycetaceae bacterium]|nr:protein kinase [Planctomycetaceae bacterium]